MFNMFNPKLSNLKRISIFQIVPTRYRHLVLTVGHARAGSQSVSQSATEPCFSYWSYSTVQNFACLISVRRGHLNCTPSPISAYLPSTNNPSTRRGGRIQHSTTASAATSRIIKTSWPPAAFSRLLPSRPRPFRTNCFFPVPTLFAKSTVPLWH
jgi:hypothetical protein